LAISGDHERDRVACDLELQGHGSDRRRRAMLDGERELVAVTTQVKIGIAPRVEFRRAAERLAAAHLPSAFARVVHEQNGEVKPALELAQVREERRDLA
jgi:hypothetical protein